MTDLEVTQVTEVHDPATGEVVRLDAPTNELARYLNETKVLISRLQEARQAVGAAVLARMDVEGRWTANVGGYKVSAPSPKPVMEYDAEALYRDLSGLAEAGVITEDARDRAVTRAWVYKTQAAGINALLKLPVVAPIVVQHGHEVERQRRVSVSEVTM